MDFKVSLNGFIGSLGVWVKLWGIGSIVTSGLRGFQGDFENEGF